MKIKVKIDNTEYEINHCPEYKLLSIDDFANWLNRMAPFDIYKRIPGHTSKDKAKFFFEVLSEYHVYRNC